MVLTCCHCWKIWSDMTISSLLGGFFLLACTYYQSFKHFLWNNSSFPKWMTYFLVYEYHNTYVRIRYNFTEASQCDSQYVVTPMEVTVLAYNFYFIYHASIILLSLASFIVFDTVALSEWMTKSSACMLCSNCENVSDHIRSYFCAQHCWLYSKHNLISSLRFQPKCPPLVLHCCPRSNQYPSPSPSQQGLISYGGIWSETSMWRIRKSTMSSRPFSSEGRHRLKCKPHTYLLGHYSFLSIVSTALD